MKKAIISAVLAALVSSSVVSISEEETAAEFFRKDQERMGKIHAEAECIMFCQSFYGEQDFSAPKTKVTSMIVAETEQKIGKRWVTTMLSIAKVESSYQCNAVGPRLGKGHHGERAMGIFQVLPSSARQLGYSGSKSELLSCSKGIEIGLAHAKRCLDWGVKSPAEMASCHVAGPAWNYPLKRRHENYKRKYVSMVIHRSRRVVTGELYAKK